MRTRFAIACLVLLGLAGCRGTPTQPDHEPQADGAPAAAPVDIGSIADAVPRAEPRSHYGNNPYVALGVRYVPLQSASGYRERGVASWYGTKFHGRRTSSGEPYDMYAMTAAHRTLPLPSYVRVTNLANGRSAVVRVNDRGPFHDDRLIDLSWAAAQKLGVIGTGTAPVEVVSVVAGAPEPAPAGGPALLYVQVGAFASQGNAAALRDRLQREHLGPVLVQTVDRAGVVFHRVRVGPISSVEEGDRMSATLRARGWPDARLVVD